MSPALPVLGALVLSASLLGLRSSDHAATPLATRERLDPPVPACMGVEAEARYVPFGYNHVVILSNACDEDVSCSVSTDANPAPIVVDVTKGTRVEVLTYRASPAPTFIAHVDCEPRGRS